MEQLVSQDRWLRVSICTAKEHTCDGSLNGKNRTTECSARKGNIPMGSMMVARIAQTLCGAKQGHSRPVVSRHCFDCAKAFLRPSVVVRKAAA